MPPGFGKSWVNLLFAHHLQVHLNKKVLYIAINQGLLNQVKKKVQQVPDLRVKSCLSS